MITGKLNLAALTHVKLELDGQKGKVKGIFIPLEINDLFEGAEDKGGGIYLNIVAFDMKEPKEYATHIMKQSFSKEKREKMTKEEQDALPILGNLKTGNSAPVEANNNPAPENTFTPTDKLPF